MASKKRGETIEVSRVIPVGQGRKTGEAILRFKDGEGQYVALRLKPRQFETLAKGVVGLWEARR